MKHTLPSFLPSRPQPASPVGQHTNWPSRSAEGINSPFATAAATSGVWQTVDADGGGGRNCPVKILVFFGKNTGAILKGRSLTNLSETAKASTAGQSKQTTTTNVRISPFSSVQRIKTRFGPNRPAADMEGIDFLRFLETFLRTSGELLRNFGEIGSLRRRLRTSGK